jgi:malonyl-ACP decarboxylase
MNKRNRKRSERSIFSSAAITGMGVVSPFGVGISPFYRALHDMDCRICRSMSFPELKAPLLISEIRSFNLAHALKARSLSQKKIMELELYLAKDLLSTHAAVLAVIEAYQQAKLNAESVDFNKVGVIISGGNLSQLQQWRQFHKHTTRPLCFASPSWALRFLDSHLLSVISALFKFKGPGITTSAASASGHAALMQGLQWIQLGIVDLCFVVGAMAELSAVEWQSLINAGALGGYSFIGAPEQACRPFDASHEGFIPGQAAACVILESSASRARREIESQGQLLSVAMCMDGSRSATPHVAGEVRAMQCALMQARVAEQEIDYINAHGTSTPAGDKAELEAIDTLFNEKQLMPWVNSTKSIIGHCLWSAGIVELISVLLQMKHNFVHGNRNLENPIKTSCRLVGKNQQRAAVKYALSNAFGFGGINSSLVVGKSS